MGPKILIGLIWLCIASVWIGLFQAYGVGGFIATYIIYLVFKKNREKK